MKPQLKRIEAALQEASSHYLPQLDPLEDSTTSWQVSATTKDVDMQHSELNLERAYDRLGSNPFDAKTTRTLDFGLEPQPTLPKFAELSDNPNQFITLTNAALALNLLKDLQAQVGQWIASLENLLAEIQALYNEGPIVDGWLESSNPTAPTQSKYRLCGLDDTGTIWYQDCPHDQVADIGLAIVRYQRLQGLLSKKQLLESKLGCLTELLVEAHGKVTEVAG